MTNTKSFIPDPKSQAALESIQRITGKDEVVCMRLALTFFAHALIQVMAIQNTKGNQVPEKADNPVMKLVRNWTGKAKKGRK